MEKKMFKTDKWAMWKFALDSAANINIKIKKNIWKLKEIFYHLHLTHNKYIETVENTKMNKKEC